LYSSSSGLNRRLFDRDPGLILRRMQGNEWPRIGHSTTCPRAQWCH
jgi:hypothetical protein